MLKLKERTTPIVELTKRARIHYGVSQQTIIKLETMEVVAEFQGKPNLDMYANILMQAGKEYGNCLLVVENVGIGKYVSEPLSLLALSAAPIADQCPTPCVAPRLQRALAT